MQNNKSRRTEKINLKNKSLLQYYGFTKAEQRKYPVVSGILKQLTPERIKKKIDEVKKIELPPELQKWVKEYERVGKRDGYIWKWLYLMFPKVQLPVSLKKHRKSLLEIKILLTIFVVQLDDAVDEKHKKKLLEELLKIISEQESLKLNNLSLEDREYLIFTKKLWNHIKNQIKKYPNYEILSRIFKYDIDQVLNAMNYSHIVNKNFYLINKTEYWLYLSSNMTFMVYLTLDLMCCHKLDHKKIGIYREVMWEAQKMGRISNWITTWQRELKDRDFTSGVFAYAMENNILSIEDFESTPIKKIENKIKKSDIEGYLLKEWNDSHNIIKYQGKKIKPVNVDSLLEGLDRLLAVDLASRGYK